MRLPKVRRPPQPGSPTAFISYRRDDSSGYAGRLHDALRERWGEGNVRMDVDDIPPGADYVRAAREMVASSDIVLVLIGKRWADGRNAERLADPEDLLRQEVETALEKDVRVIPVLLNGAAMPAPEVLPPSLAPLLRRNAFELSERRWTYDVQDLVTTVERLPARAAAPDPREPGPGDRPQPPPPPPSGPTTAPRSRRPVPWRKAGLALLAVAVVLAAAFLLDDLWVGPEPMSGPVDATEVVPDSLRPLEPVAEEDCSRYNPRALRIESDAGWGWRLTDGAVTMAFLDDEADARRALALARRHTEHCFIGRPVPELVDAGVGNPDEARYVTDYWIGDSGIATTLSGEDCVAYSPATLTVVEESRSGPSWLLQDGAGNRTLARFASLAAANRGLLVAREAGELCYIGRDNDRPDAEAYVVEYWR